LREAGEHVGGWHEGMELEVSDDDVAGETSAASEVRSE
jgi:hypothetical protein